LLREQLGYEAFTSAWAEGRIMRLEDAIAAALAVEQPAEPASEEQARERAQSRSAGPAAPTFVGLNTQRLTRREQEVAALLARGLTNRQIAEELTIAERTAETHVLKIMNKLGLNRRAQLTAWALKHELTPPS